MIHLKDSTIKLDCVAAITKGLVPETNFTPVYYTMVVYLIGCAQPIVHTYESAEERDEIFTEFRDVLDEHRKLSNT